MKKIIVGLSGTTPLLMHNPSVMRSGEGGGQKVIPTAEVEAAAARYLMPGSDDTLALKADHIGRCLFNASKGFRLQGRESVVPYIAGSIEVQPDWISLGAAKYEIDTRRVVLNRKDGILRSRPIIWPWACEFELLYDDMVFSEKFMDVTLREKILLRAGTAIGLLDYRPQKGGKYGRFVVSKWER